MACGGCTSHSGECTSHVACHMWLHMHPIIIHCQVANNNNNAHKHCTLPVLEGSVCVCGVCGGMCVCVVFPSQCDGHTPACIFRLRVHLSMCALFSGYRVCYGHWVCWVCWSMTCATPFCTGVGAIRQRVTIVGVAASSRHGGCNTMFSCCCQLLVLVFQGCPRLLARKKLSSLCSYMQWSQTTCIFS